MRLTDEWMDDIEEALTDCYGHDRSVAQRVTSAIRELLNTAAETVLFHEQDYGFCLDPKCRCCAALKKLKALLPEVTNGS